MKKKKEQPDQKKNTPSVDDSAPALLDTGMQRMLKQDGDSGPEKKPVKPGKPSPDSQTHFDLKSQKSTEPTDTEATKTPVSGPETSGQTQQILAQLGDFVSDMGPTSEPAPDPKPKPVTEPKPKPKTKTKTKTKPVPEPKVQKKSNKAVKPPPQAAETLEFERPVAGEQAMQTAGVAGKSGLKQLTEKLNGLPRWVLPAAAGSVLVLLLLAFWPSSEGPELVPSVGDTEPVPDKQDRNQLTRLQTSTTGKLAALRSILDTANARAESLAQQLLLPEMDQQIKLVLQLESMQASEKVAAIQTHIVNGAGLDQIELSIAYFPAELDPEQLVEAFDTLQKANRELDSAAAELDRLSRMYTKQAMHDDLVTRWQSFGLKWPLDPVEIESLAKGSTGLPEDVASLLDLIARSDPAAQVTALVANGEFAAGIEAWSDASTALEVLISSAAQQYDDKSGQLKRLLDKAELAIQNKQLTSPEDDNALAYFRTVLELDPGNLAAEAGLDQLVRAYHKLAKSALVAGNEALARQHAARARSVLPESPIVATMQREIASFGQSSRSDQIGQLIQAGLQAELAGDFERLAALLKEARDVAREPSDYMDLEAAFLRLKSQPGRQFSDLLSAGDLAGPEMIVVPAGQFTMGNGSKMLGAVRSERPAHTVILEQRFAVSRTEITVAQFAEFVTATGYQTDAENGAMIEVLVGPEPQLVQGRNWRNDYLGGEAASSDPVVHVSWQDAQQYAQWLTESTASNYRLLSESEFEFLLRAGSQGRYLWDGNSPPEKTHNLNGQLDEPPATWGGKRARAAVKRYGDSWFGPAPAVSFPANAFGIKHLLGNVSEWVEDCYISDFKNKGTGQLARQLDGCEQRTVRGASWGSDKASLRASWRGKAPANQGSNRLGFRVAVDLQ